MKTEQIIILIVSFFLGMLLLNMVKNVCGCELKEGFIENPDLGYLRNRCNETGTTALNQAAGSCGAQKDGFGNLLSAGKFKGGPMAYSPGANDRGDGPPDHYCPENADGSECSPITD